MLTMNRWLHTHRAELRTTAIMLIHIGMDGVCGTCLNLPRLSQEWSYVGRLINSLGMLGFMLCLNDDPATSHARKRIGGVFGVVIGTFLHGCSSSTSPVANIWLYGLFGAVYTAGHLLMLPLLSDV